MLQHEGEGQTKKNYIKNKKNQPARMAFFNWIG